MPSDIEEREIEEPVPVAAQAAADTAIPMSPVQFFDAGEHSGIDRDFRPHPMEEAPTEDGHGNRYMNPPNDGGNVLNPGKAHDPQVVPYRDRDSSDRTLQTTLAPEVEQEADSEDEVTEIPDGLTGTHPSTSSPLGSSIPPNPMAQEAAPKTE